MFEFRVVGGTRRLQRILKRLSTAELMGILDKYGKVGVNALAAATPKDTGKTAGSWSHEIVPTNQGYTIQFLNSHVNKGVNIAIIIQTGHGTGTGGYVQGVDYINPATRKVFEQIKDDILREVIQRG